MNNGLDSQPATRPLERFLAVTSTVVCLTVTADIWQAFSPRQPMWPLPGLYLVEILLLSIAVAVAVVRDVSFGGTLIWGSLGATCAFAVLAAWTIGLLYLPIILLSATTGILFLRRRGERFPIHLAISAAAALAQGAVILVAINLLNP